MLQIPFRQKAILLTVVLLGLTIVGAYALRLLATGSLNIITLIYGFTVPFVLLAFDLLIDLNDKKVFRCWIIIGFIFFLSFLLFRDAQALIIRPISPDDPKHYRWIGNSAGEGLKCLPLFLLAYWILNYLSRKIRGKTIVSTYQLNQWYSYAGNRKVDWVDVLINILLFLIILIGLVIKI